MRLAQKPTLGSKAVAPAGMLALKAWLLVSVTVPEVPEKAAFQLL